MKVLILGGYGAFGARLAHVLGDLPQLHLLIAGRTATKARAFCDAYDGAPQVEPITLDRADIATALPNLSPDLLIEASGPFQAYGAAGYSVVQACIDQCVPYLDLADGRDFVAGISHYDAAAKAAGIYVRSGVSSCPALTDAAVRALGQGMQITRITGGIAPTPRAGLGLSVLRGVLGYVGQPVAHLSNGREITTPGLGETRRVTIAPPGVQPLDSTVFAMCDTPELSVLPQAYPDLRSIWFGAGTRPQFMLRALHLYAKLCLPPLTRLAPLAHRLQRYTQWGAHRGGMFVAVDGMKNGAPHSASWHLLAEGDDGPLIPTMAISATLRKILSGEPPAIGAQPAIGELTLDDFRTAFGTRAIRMGVHQHIGGDQPLYKRILGPAFDEMDAPLQSLHDGSAQSRWSGTAQVTRGKNPIARLSAWLFGFPPANDATPVTVTLTSEAGREIWQRDFNGKRFRSTQYAGTGRHARLLMERFGPVTVALAVTVQNGRLDLIPQSWRVFGIPLPRWSRPKGDCFERGGDGDFHFDVTIGAPIIGVIVRYAGTLQREI